jgi:hypothetical protein
MPHDVINASMIRCMCMSCGMYLKARYIHISCILEFMFSHVRVTLCHLISRFHFLLSDNVDIIIVTWLSPYYHTCTWARMIHIPLDILGRKLTFGMFIDRVIQ